MKGVRICRQTKALWVNEFVEREHPHGGHYYWMTGDFMDIEQDAEDTDRWALQHDYVAITPVQIDVTAYALFEELKKWDLNV